MDIKSLRSKWKVSIIIPTKNEEETIDEVLTKIKPYGDEIIVIDGHSSDNTKKIVKKHRIKFFLDNGKGKGAAVRLGLEIASNPIVVFIDADGSHEPKDIPKLIKPIREDIADLVIGSRMTGGSDELFSDFYEFIRLTGSMIINLAINYRWNVRLSDTQNGFRAIVRDIGRYIKLTANSTTIEQEMVMKCLNYGYRVINVPSHEYKRKGGESKILVSKVWLAYVWNMMRFVFLSPSKKKFFKKF